MNTVLEGVAFFFSGREISLSLYNIVTILKISIDIFVIVGNCSNFLVIERFQALWTDI